MSEIDEETLGIIISYCGGDPRIAREIEVVVFHEYGDESWTIPEFKAAIDHAINEIPEQHRAEAVVSLEGGYEESARLKITYTRLQNQEEIAERVRRALNYARDKQAKDLSTYEALKKKFEKDKP